MDAGMVAAVVDAEQRTFAVCGEALRRARQELQMTQLRLAEVSGVDASTISQVENAARRQIRALTLARLSEALDVAPADLLIGEDRDEQ